MARVLLAEVRVPETSDLHTPCTHSRPALSRHSISAHPDFVCQGDYHCSGSDTLLGSASVGASIFILLLIGWVVGAACGALFHHLWASKRRVQEVGRLAGRALPRPCICAALPAEQGAMPCCQPRWGLLRAPPAPAQCCSLTRARPAASLERSDHRRS